MLDNQTLDNHQSPQAFPAYKVPQAFADDMADKFAAMGDSLMAYELLEALLDPIALDDSSLSSIDSKQMGAMLRIVNGHFHTWKSAAQSLLDKAS